MALCDPVSIILVTAGSRGQKVLFRYPYQPPREKEKQQKGTSNSQYALPKVKEHTHVRNFSGIKDGFLVGFSDITLANILSPKPETCGSKFELKIDDVLFVGHPTLAQEGERESKRTESTRKEDMMMKLFNVVFVLQASVLPSMIQCYHDLSKRLAIALKHEELRCRYLSSERETMLCVHDEMSSMPEDCAESPFQHMLPKSKLAHGLKETFDSLCSAGTVHLKINNWVNVSFCLPHKVLSLSEGALHTKRQVIHSSLAAIRPYHTLLFLVDERSLLASLPGDCSPAVTRLVRMARPLKSFQTLSQDTDIPLSQVFAISAHLVYWGMATIMYPLCESNVYAVAPNASTNVSSSLAEAFTASFPRMSLHAVLSEYSLPAPLREQRNPFGLPQQQAEQVQMVVWLLQHRLLIQLHTYVFLLPPIQPIQRAHSTRKDAIAHRPVRWMFGSSSDYGFRNGADTQLEETERVDEEFGALLFGLSVEEQNSVLQVSAASEPEDLKLFASLTRYFRGSHHLEEIMYYENLRRSQLLTILDKFREVLSLCQHEDPATVYF